MQSEGSQANMGDSDDITGTLNSVQDRVKDLLSHTTSLIDQMRSRDGNISQSHSMLDRLESRVNEMAAISQELNYALETASQTEDDSSRELDDLIAERGESKYRVTSLYCRINLAGTYHRNEVILTSMRIRPYFDVMCLLGIFLI